MLTFDVCSSLNHLIITRLSPTVSRCEMEVLIHALSLIRSGLLEFVAGLLTRLLWGWEWKETVLLQQWPQDKTLLLFYLHNLSWCSEGRGLFWQWTDYRPVHFELLKTGICHNIKYLYFLNSWCNIFDKAESLHFSHMLAVSFKIISFKICRHFG